MPSKKTKKSEPKTEKIEREYIIPLRKRFKHVPRYKKTPKAIKTIKEFLVRHMKIRDRDLSKIKIDGYLNEAVWQKGIKNPPSKIKVKALKKGDIIRVELVDFPEKLKFKKLRLEKIEKAGEEIAKKKKKVEKEKPEDKEEVEKKLEEKKVDTEDKKSSVPQKSKISEERKKAKAGEEATKKLEKAAAKKAKHQVGGKTKQPKRQIRKALAK